MASDGEGQLSAVVQPQSALQVQAAASALPSVKIGSNAVVVGRQLGQVVVLASRAALSASRSAFPAGSAKLLLRLCESAERSI